MRGRVAAAVAVLLGIGGAAFVAGVALRPGAVPEPRPSEREERRAEPRTRPPRLVPAPVQAVALDPPAPPLPPESFPDAPEEDDGWKEYPEDATGPVVVGVVVRWGKDNPECSIALESVDDPARRDPSVLEDLPNGRFRLVGFPPGRYRVRVKADETTAAYSGVLVAEDGKVADAGLVRIRRPGCIAGVVRDRAGAFAAAEVRLFGRHPENLDPMVVERAKAIGAQGFQLLPHEAGEFLLAVEGDAGWALLPGRTDADGLAWAVVTLRPWSSVTASLAPRTPTGGMADAILRTTVERVEAPDLGAASYERTAVAGAAVGRLAAGSHRVVVSWRRFDGDRWEDRSWSKVVILGEGEAAKVEVPR